MSNLQSFVTAIKNCEGTSKSTEKMVFLQGLDSTAQQMMAEALNPYRVFGVKKYDKPESYAKEDASPDVFFNVLNRLASRQITGNIARSTLSAALGSYTEETAKYLARVVGKDLKCGVTETTLNKLYPNLVPVYDVMLAGKVDSKFKWYFPVMADAKLDGQRVTAFCENGVVNYFSRSGKEADFCNGLFDDEIIRLSEELRSPLVLDGEVMGDTYIETMNAKGSEADSAKAKLKFHVFDICGKTAWDQGIFNVPNKVRVELIDSNFSKLGLTKLVPVLRKICQNMDELRDFYRHVLDLGYEGLILKDPDSMYEKKRSKSWMKWKPVYQADLTIVGVYAGNEGTKNADKMGGFTLKGEDENGNKIESDCGSLQVGKSEVLIKFIGDLMVKEGVDPSTNNYDQFFRSYVWNHQEEFIGKTAQIEYQELSKTEGRPGVFSLRFPTFEFLRDDK